MTIQEINAFIAQGRRGFARVEHAGAVISSRVYGTIRNGRRVNVVRFCKDGETITKSEAVAFLQTGALSARLSLKDQGHNDRKHAPAKGEQ